MPTCGNCTNSLNRKSPGIQCTTCRVFFHANSRCSDVAKNQISLITNIPGGRWECVTCRGGVAVDAASSSMARVSLSPVRGTSLSDRDEVGGEVGALKIDESRLMMLVRAEVSAVRDDIRELRNSVTFFSDKITDFESKLTKLNDVFKLANQMRAENELLKKEISNIHFRLDTVEQNSRINNLEITDIPETKNENLNGIVKRIGEYVGLVVDPSAVSSVVRVPTKIVGKPKNIVVKFVSKLKRDELMSAIKVKRNIEGKNGFSIDGLSNRFYVNEHLTTRNKIIFKAARAAAKEKGYKYVWTQNGNILMRKNDTAKIVHIQDIWVVLSINDRKIYISCVYIAPGDDEACAAFSRKLESNRSKIRDQDLLLVCGDFNCSSLEWVLLIHTQVNIMESGSDNYKVHPESNLGTKVEKPSKKSGLLHEVRTHFRSYCNHTSIHGFQYFGQNRTIVERCWWVLIFMCIISSCGFCIYLIYKKWQRSPVIVSLTTIDTPIYQVPFPAVTICPTIRFSKECMDFDALYQNVTKGALDKQNITTWTKEEKNFLHYMIPLCKRNGLLQLIDEARSSDDIYEAIKNCSPFVSGDGTSVHFMDQILNFNDSFRKIFTEDGLCFSFNMLSSRDIFKNNTNLNKLSDGHAPKSAWISQHGYSMDAGLNTFPRRALLSGAANSLEVKLRHRKKDIDYLCTGAQQGYKVILHLPTRVPRPALEYNMAPFGKSTTITVNPHMMSTSEVVKEYDPHKRDCYFPEEKFLKFFKIYSKTNCDFECITNYTLRECGCVPFEMPREDSTPVCGIGMRDCVILTLEKYNLMKLKSKLKESKQLSPYLRSSVFVQLADNYTVVNDTNVGEKRQKRQISPLLEDADEDEARCSCLRSCNDITYKGAATTTDYKWKESILDDISDSSSEYDYTLITIYLDTNVVFTTERNELYGPTDFLSNFGGLLGLFTGFSILSFMEIIYFCTLRVFGNKRLIGRWYGDKEA